MAAIIEASRFHEKQGPVYESLPQITTELEGLGITYAILGGMALVAHGYERGTIDIDVLVTSGAYDAVRCELVGTRYQSPFRKPFSLRDAETGVRIDFFIAGQFPGDGKPKPVAFPDPAKVAMEIDGIKYVNLPTLIDLKLASGMTNPGRLRDLADVQELIRVLNLTDDFAEKLNPFVRERFMELLEAVQFDPTEDESNA